jgi:teichuronic acid biosynthesis glycosyltransferase TuaC
MMPIRLLTFSTLFPNNARPNHGVFVENRLRHLVASGEAASLVIAPVPWFPSNNPTFGDWAVNARVVREESRHGLTILHPRYPVIPKVGMSLAPWLLYRAMVPVVRRLMAQKPRFDVIDAHYLYPDGVAAAWLGQRFALPVVMTARGTDVSLIPRFARPRRMIRQAIESAAAVIAVSAALKEALVEIGASAAKITVLRNGADTLLFQPPPDRPAGRAAAGFTRPTLISVGLLIERKGHHRTIEAMVGLPDFDLVIVGEGPEHDRLNALISRLGLSGRVRLLGARPHAELPSLYGAADASVLSSSREGWANVLLESMACGTPVVASPIWGNPEVVRTPAAGVITRENSPAGIVEGVRQLFATSASREATREYAEPFSWDETTAGQLELFRRVIAARAES